jgi:hypothetical protein
MSVPSQGAVFSFSPQAAKVGRDGTFTPGTYYKMRVVRDGVNTVNGQQNFPLENGGDLVPTGTYKVGQYLDGDVDFIPRIEGTLGYLLWAVMGKYTGNANNNYGVGGFVAGVTGVNAHKFSFDPSDQAFQPWISIRRKIPGNGSSNVWGEQSHDVKINGLQLNIPAAGLLSARLMVRGRVVEYPLPATVNAWSYSNSFEDSDSAPVSGSGTFKLGGESVAVTGASITVANNLSAPQQEMIVGSYNPDDFVALTRAVSIRIVLKWNDPDLYRRVLTNGITGIVWDAEPFIQRTAGTTKAFEATFYSPADIASSSPVQKYCMKLYANKVTWAVDQAGIDVQAGGIIQVPFVGTVLAADDSLDYLEIALENDHAVYTWPAAPIVLLPTGVVTFDISSGAPVNLDAAATFTDSDSSVFTGGGTLTAEFLANGQTLDTLIVQNIGSGVGQIGVSAANVQINAVTFATKAGGTNGSTPLVITFTAGGATPTNIQLLLRALQFDTTDTTQIDRIVKITVRDPDGNVGTDTITVSLVA